MLLGHVSYARVQASSLDNMLSPDATPRSIDGIEIAVFEGEAVLFDEEASMVHRLGAVAGAVWMCCDGETAIGAIVRELADVFDMPAVELEASVSEVLEQFEAEGLLVGSSKPMRSALIPDPVLAEDGTEILVAPPDP